MYKSFILLILLTACQTTTSNKQVIPVFNQYMNLYNQDSKLKYGENDYKQKKEILTNYEFGKYAKALTIFSKNYCSKPNKEVLNKFIELLIATEDSVFETPSTTLGEIYVCQADSVIAKIKSLNKEDQKYIINSLYFGFQNTVYKKENTIKNYKQLINQLKNLKNNIHTIY